MAKVAGRKIRIYQGVGGSKTIVAGARADSITINNEAIDVTDKASDGWRELLNDASVRSVDMSVEGLLDGDALLAASLGDTTNLLGLYTIDIQGIGTCQGLFHFSSFEIGAPHDDAATFTASIMSAGEISFVSGAGSSKPTNSVAPTITGTAKVAQVLTGVQGTWAGSPAPSYARQWLADGVPIVGATAATYTPVIGDIGRAISYRVTGSNIAGSTSVTSIPTDVVVA